MNKFRSGVKLRRERNPVAGEGNLERPLRIQFFQAVSLFLWCRLHEMDDDHEDKFGALLGSLDWQAEMKLILEEWRHGNHDTRRS